MIVSLGIFALLSALGIGLTAFAWLTEFRFGKEDHRHESFTWLRRWTIQGFLTPWILWVLMNYGFSFEFQSFMPRLQIAQGTKDWLPIFAAYIGGGFCVIASYWTAMTLAWIILRSSRGLEGELWTHYRTLCLSSVLGMALPAIGIVILGGWNSLGIAATAMLTPIAGYGPTILRPKKMPPLYARAIARMKFGKYSEAEQEVIQQLEKREDDFDGWMMLADLYANHFNNLSEAEQTVLEICDQPRTTPSQISIALHKLADWHLKLRGDPEAARRALGVIVNRLPGSHLARMAETRMAQLPNSAEEWREQNLNKTVHLPALHDPLDETAEPPASSMNARQATDRANQLKARLKSHPEDAKPREELARLLAGPLNQPEAGIAQVETLLALPNQAPEIRANWVGMIATWQIERLRNMEAGRETLRRLIREYPGTSTAFAAQRQLLNLDAQEKLARARAAKPPPIRIRIDMEDSNPPSQS